MTLISLFVLLKCFIDLLMCFLLHLSMMMDLWETTNHFEILWAFFLLKLFGFEISGILVILVNGLGDIFETLCGLFDFKGVGFVLNLM